MNFQIVSRLKLAVKTGQAWPGMAKGPDLVRMLWNRGGRCGSWTAVRIEGVKAKRSPPHGTGQLSIRRWLPHPAFQGQGRQNYCDWALKVDDQFPHHLCPHLPEDLDHFKPWHTAKRVSTPTTRDSVGREEEAGRPRDEISSHRTSLSRSGHVASIQVSWNQLPPAEPTGETKAATILVKEEETTYIPETLPGTCHNSLSSSWESLVLIFSHYIAYFLLCAENSPLRDDLKNDRY